MLDFGGFDFGFRIWYSVFWILDLGFGIWEFGLWLLDFGFIKNDENQTSVIKLFMWSIGLTIAIWVPLYFFYHLNKNTSPNKFLTLIGGRYSYIGGYS